MILIDNATQSELLTMAECVDALERAFGAIDSGQAITRWRRGRRACATGPGWA